MRNMPMQTDIQKPRLRSAADAGCPVLAMRVTALIFSLLILAEAHALDASYRGMSIKIPDSWHLNFSVINDDSGAKVGELISKHSWNYTSGEEFIGAFKAGFIDDPDTTKFIDSGKAGEIFWVCRLGEYEDGKGDFGYWYSRVFWVNGPLVVFYSYDSCTDQFEEVLRVAGTLTES